MVGISLQCVLYTCIDDITLAFKSMNPEHLNDYLFYYFCKLKCLTWLMPGFYFDKRAYHQTKQYLP